MSPSSGVRDDRPTSSLLFDLAVVLAVLVLPCATAGAAPLDHRAQVALVPAEHRLTIEDDLRLPAGRAEVRFVLHAGLDPEVTTAGVSLEALPGPPTAEQLGLSPDDAAGFPPETPGVIVYALRAEDGALPPAVTLRYGGVIHHPLESAGEEYDRSFRETVGTIEEDGCLPRRLDLLVAPARVETRTDRGSGLVTFALDVRASGRVGRGERGGRAPSTPAERTGTARALGPGDAGGGGPPGRRPLHRLRALGRRGRPSTPTCGRPTRRWPPGTSTAGAQYLAMYDQLIGPYPYPKLALVENFWETGYGMPSFTLLGPTVLRFPFILRSSWPHEILHNWWGNGVFPPDASAATGARG